MPDLIKRNDKCEMLKKDSVPVRFEHFWLSDMCARILALDIGSESTGGNISASVSKLAMKVIRKLEEMFR